MTTIGPMDTVATSDTLTITFSYGSVLPELLLTEDGVRDAVSSLGHNVLMVDVDTLIGFRKIRVQFHPATSAEAGVIGKALETAIREWFTSVYSVTADKYELGGEPIFTTQGAISLASIAIISAVGIGMFFYLKGGR